MVTELESNIPKCVLQFLLKHNFFSLKSLSFLPKIAKLRLICLQNKFSFIKLGLIVFIGSAWIAAHHVGSFKSLLLELFITISRLNF